jgi:hypothetical protein
MSAANAGAAKALKAAATGRSHFIDIPHYTSTARSTNNLPLIWLLRGEAGGVLAQL